LGCLLLGCESTGSSELSVRDQAIFGLRRDLSHRDWAGADMSRAMLINADLSGSILVRADFHGNDLSSVRAVGANFDHANLAHARLGWSVLRGSSMRGANLFASILIHADLRGVDMSDADLTRVQWKNAHVMGAKLANAKGLDPSMVGLVACWDARTEWPLGWELPHAEQACEKHGQGAFSPGSAVRSFQQKSQTKIMMREKRE
jgi:uncharacterized protein YjbI with pentapeptide repeats